MDMKAAIEDFLLKDEKDFKALTEARRKILKEKNPKKRQNLESKIESLEEKVRLLRNALLPNSAFKTWVEENVNKAKHVTSVTHAPKFTHPNAKADGVLACGDLRNDGLLRTGNVFRLNMDYLSSASYASVSTFLSTKDPQEATVLEHLEKNTSAIRELFEAWGVENFDEVRRVLLQVRNSPETPATHSLVKQVYFPVEDDAYHLLSVLTPSGIQDALKQRVDEALYSEKARAASKARKDGTNAIHHRSFPGRVTLQFGGAEWQKQRNISHLNPLQRGKAYLLPSMPPRLRHDRPQLPTRSFFTQVLRYRMAEHHLKDLAKFLQVGWNNQAIRDGRDRRLLAIAETVVREGAKIQSWSSGWSQDPRYSGLPVWEKCWLDLEARSLQDDEVEVAADKGWRRVIAKECARWVILAYQRINKDVESFGDPEMNHICDLFEDEGVIQ